MAHTNLHRVIKYTILNGSPSTRRSTGLSTASPGIHLSYQKTIDQVEFHPVSIYTRKYKKSAQQSGRWEWHAHCDSTHFIYIESGEKPNFAIRGKGPSTYAQSIWQTSQRLCVAAPIHHVTSRGIAVYSRFIMVLDWFGCTSPQSWIYNQFSGSTETKDRWRRLRTTK